MRVFIQMDSLPAPANAAGMISRCGRWLDNIDKVASQAAPTTVAIQRRLPKDPVTDRPCQRLP